MTKYGYKYDVGEVCPVFRIEEDKRSTKEKIEIFMRNQEFMQKFEDMIMPGCLKKNAERRKKFYAR